MANKTPSKDSKGKSPSAKGSSSAGSKTPKIKDLSPRKDPRGGDRPPRYPDGNNNPDE